MSTKELLDDYEKAKLPEEASQGGAQCLSVQGPSQGSKEVIHVQWKKAIWVTVRDQIMSPFLQGAFWAVLVYFCNPYSVSLGSKLGHFMYAKPPPKEGHAAGWLREWVKTLGLASK